MSVHPTTKQLARGAAVAGTLIASLAFPGAASVTHGPDATRVDGNPNCASIAAGYREVKIDPVPQGTTKFGSGVIKVSGLYFDWGTTTGVDVVIVKGGPNANLYRFNEATSGRWFRAPINGKTGKPYGLSHITFCFDGEQPTP